MGIMLYSPAFRVDVNARQIRKLAPISFQNHVSPTRYPTCTVTPCVQDSSKVILPAVNLVQTEASS